MGAEKVILLLGSNRGDRQAILERAVALLRQRAGEVTGLSSYYETEPWGFEDPVPFLNRAVILSTVLGPEALLAVTRGIEQEMGRTRGRAGYEGRTLDIDILFFGDRILDTPVLQVPHPRMAQRRFVLAPLAEIAGTLKHPVTGLTAGEMLERCEDRGWVRKADDLNPSASS